LEQESGLPDGQEVSVTLQAASSSGDGLRASFGSWADDAQEVDHFLEQVRRGRSQARRWSMI
jgi:hypothetical protein